MENKIQVTILMPIYKVEKFLEKALDSVFTQTYPFLDYVFVNDGSPDNSFQVLKDVIARYQIEPDRYTIVSHVHNEGIAVSRTECVSHAKGDYVYFVDGDDWIEKDTVEQMVAATKGGTIDIVGCDYMKDYLSGKITCHYEDYAETCRDNFIKCLNYEIATVLWKLLIKRSLFENFEISPINIGEDYIISIKLYYYANSFFPLHKAFYHYVQYNQDRLSYQSIRSVNDHIKCVNDVERFLRKKGDYDANIKHKLLLRKFNIKSNFILNKRLLSEEEFNNTFPETRGIWHEMGYSWKECVKFWFAEHGLFKLLKQFLK